MSLQAVGGWEREQEGSRDKMAELNSVGDGAGPGREGFRVGVGLMRARRNRSN